MPTPTALPASFTAGDVLTAANMNLLRGAFRILQVVEGTSDTQTLTTSTAFVTTNLSASITPSSTSSKVLVFAHTCGAQNNLAGSSYYTLFRGTVAGTNIGNGNNGLQRIFHGTTIDAYIPVFMVKLDSPSTTSSQTYTVGMRTDNAANTAAAQIGSARGVIILCEVSA